MSARIFSGIVRYYKTYFYDAGFYKNKIQYLIQCGLATLVVLATLLTLNVLPNAVVIASIGATAFVVFTLPHKRSTDTHCIIGAYTVGILVGSCCYFLAHFVAALHAVVFQVYYDEIFGALAVGLAMFLMVIFNSQHPPAAALALGLVLNEWSLKAIIVTVIAVLVTLLFRFLLTDYLIDL